MNENYSSVAASLSCLFPSIEEVHRFEYEGSSVTQLLSQDSVGISCYFEDFYAVAEGNALTIFEFKDKDGDAISDIIAEIEFDNVLKFLQWDISGQCLALSDDQGIIHLVNRGGLLLFSKQVFSVATGVSIRGLQFVGDQPSSQSLCAVLSNGNFLAIRELDMLRLSQLNESQLNMIPQFLKQAKFLSIKLLESGEILQSKLSVVKEVVTVVILDENSELVIYEIPLFSETTVKEVQGFTPKALIDDKIVDFRFLDSGFLSLLVLTSSGRLLVGSVGEEEDDETDAEVERWTNFHLDNNQSSILSLHSPSFVSKEEWNEGNLRSVWQLLLQQRTVDGSKRLFLFSVVSQIHDGMPFFIVLPHGCEENVLPTTPFLSSNFVGNQIILVLLDSTIVVYSFSRISVQFTFAMRNNTTDEVSLSSNTSFDVFLQVFIAFLFRAIIQSDISEINRMSQACLDRLFPSEIVLSLGLLLDCCGDKIDDSVYLQCLSLMVNVLHQQTKQLRDIGLTACQTIANKWNHQYLLAKRFHRHFSYADKFPCQITKLLFPLDVKGFIEVLLLKGKINEVLFFYDHLIGFSFPNNMASLISSVPKDSPIDLLTDLFVFYLETEREKRFDALAAGKTNSQDYLTKVLVIATELFQRGRDQSLAVNDNEAVITKAFNTCSQLLQVCKATIILPAQEIGIVFDENLENNQALSIQRLVSKLMQFEEYLKIVLLSRSILKMPYSLEEVMASGLKGLLFSCMNQLSVENLSHFIRGPLTEFLTHFPSDNEVSSLLNDWVEMSIQDYLLTSSSFLESGEEEDEKDHSEEDEHEKRNLEKFQQCLEALLRLTTVLSCLHDRWKGTSLLMKVLNIPSIELLCIQDTSGRLISDLLELGKSLSEKVNGAIYDQLSEAIRLFRMKCIALRYQIQSFDIKDRDHLIFVISIILNSNQRNKVEDAFSFAIDESSSVRIDCKPALIRILIHFLQNTDFNTESTESSLIADYDEKLKNLVEKIPSFMVSIILEDVLSFCVDEINDSCDNNKLFMDDWEGEDDKERKKIALQRYSKGCIKLLEYYQDITTASTKTINQNVLARTQAPVQSSFNPANGTVPTNGTVNVKSVHKSSLLTDSRLLQGLKNIFQLQSAFNVYLNLQNLKSSADCKKLIETLAADIVTRWKKSSQSTSSNTKTGNEWDVNQLVNECFSLKKICSILDASCQIYVFHIAKSLIGLGKKMQALEFLRLNAEELLSNAAASGESWSLTSSSQSRNNGGNYSSSEDGQKKSNIQNWNLMVDGANLLCYSALKNERSTKTYGYYAQSTSSGSSGNDDKAFEIDAYSLSQLLLRNSILHCDKSVLPRALDALTLTDTVLTVYDRIEKDLSSASSVAASANTVANSSSINSDATTMVITIGDNVFNKDGLLMSEDSIRSALTQYCIQEMKRREVSYEAVAPSSSSASESTKKNAKSTTANTSSISAGPSTIDVENVISVLQKYENHLIAMQILFRSWSSSSAKISFLRSSLTSLCRKVLTYHNIDTTFAVACLSALPIDVIIKELKAAVPTIQSDFSRLHTVALIGEEIAYLCDQESLLLLFQSLQTNAKWWYLLSNIGINIDLKLFQHSDDTLREQYIESLIPEILKRNNYQLDLLMDYCQSFDLKPEKACLAYLELVFLDPTVSFQPASSSVVAASTTSSSGGRASYVSSSTSSLPSSSWISKVKAITNGIHENIIRNYLFKILLKMNPFEYDKISFLCQWLMEITPADAMSSSTSQASSVVDREVKGQTIYEVENEDEGELGGGLLDNSVILGSLNSSIVTTSTISSTGSDGGNGPRKSLLYWLNNYHVIIDIINLLNSIHLPSPMVQKVRKLPQIDRIYKKYEGSGTSSPLSALRTASRSNAYDHRFPLWILLLNPYLLFEPILDDVITVFQEKLSLLLMLLQLNIEDFTVKSIYAYYITLLQQPIYLNQTEKVLEVIQQTIQEKLGGKTLLCQIKVWELIYDKEVQPGQGNSKQIAILALEKILALFEQDKKYSSLLGNDGQTVGNQHQITMSTLENSFQEKLKKLRIEFILIRLFQLLQSKSHIIDPQKFVASSLSLELKEVSSWLELFIQYPKEMIKAILALFVEFFWQTIVMKSSNPSGQSTSADSLDMMLGYSLNHLILQFFRSHELLEDFLLLAHYCAQLNSSNNNTDSSVGVSGGQQFLQAVLISLMNHYLTEMHVTFNSSTSTITTTSSTSNNSASSAPSSGMNANSTGKPATSASSSLWEFSDSLLGGITGSKAEHRRHEDFFLAFAINLLTLFTSASSTSSSSGEERLHTLQYLDSIMRANNGTKSMRRFNTRSRLRASVALHFLASTINSSSSFNSSSLSSYNFTEAERSVLEKSDVFHHVAYYFLLAEIHEIRLSTSEDMILHCLSFTLTPSSSTQEIQLLQDSTDAAAIGSRNLRRESYDHLKSVISTWMHDEGRLIDVMELCCDLFHLFFFYSTTASAPSSKVAMKMVLSLDDASLVLKMVQTMLQHQHYRIIYRFLILLSRQRQYMMLYEHLLYQADVNRAIVEALFTMLLSLLEKANQQVAKNVREDEDNKPIAMTSFIFGELKRISIISNELQALNHEHHADDDVHSLTKDKKMMGLEEEQDKENQTRHFTNTTSRAIDPSNPQKDRGAPAAITALSNKEMAILKSIYSPSIASIHYPLPRSSVSSGGSQQAALLLLTKEVSGLLCAFLEAYLFMHGVRSSPVVLSKYEDVVTQLDLLSANTSSASQWWKEAADQWHAEELVALVEKAKGK